MRAIKTEELKQHPVLLASPQFGGNCHTIFARSLADLALLAGQYGLPLGTCFYLNESLITRARNYCADVFMQSPAEHLLFIDADIGFKAQDALELLILQIQNTEYEIIGGPYKKKEIGAGYAYNYDVPVDWDSKEPVEVTGIGTGFMLIKRSVLEKFQHEFPQFRYKTDDKNPRAIMQYFQAEIDPASRRYLSEDYWFSARCKEIGIRTWLCPWMKLRHAGTFIFE